MTGFPSHDRPTAGSVLLAPFLEYYPDQGGPAQYILIAPLPFRIGRSKSAHCMIGSPRVSKDHAEISLVAGEFQIRDLGSTNGTFVNGRRITSSPLVEGDILHFAQTEYLFSYGGSKPRALPTEVASGFLPASFIRQRGHLKDLLRQQSVMALFQPIVNMLSQRPMGFEALGRGTSGNLSTSPAELFQLAEECNLAGELSRTFHKAALEQAQLLPENSHVFLNTHPSELNSPALMSELSRLRESLREDQQPVLEIHEFAVPDIASMREFQRKTRDLDILIAFDDFGAGQARLLELAEAPPDFIKLDRGLISDIDQGGARLGVVRSLCRVILDQGIQIIAEGIETPAEAQVCKSLGCHYAQGYLFGKPQTVTSLGGH